MIDFYIKVTLCIYLQDCKIWLLEQYFSR